LRFGGGRIKWEISGITIGLTKELATTSWVYILEWLGVMSRYKKWSGVMKKDKTADRWTTE
jgi:hypothetical protein